MMPRVIVESNGIVLIYDKIKFITKARTRTQASNL